MRPADDALSDTALPSFLRDRPPSTYAVANSSGATASGSGPDRADVSGAPGTPSGSKVASAGAKKRGKGGAAEGSDGEERKPKKTRQTQSCDACRARKVKCDRPPPGTAADDLPTKDLCSHCRQLGMACTFEYKPKKRGPPNMYLKRMQALSGQAHATAGPSDAAGDYALVGGGSHAYKVVDDYRDHHSGPGPGTLAKQNALHRSALSVQGGGGASGASGQAGGGALLRGTDAVDDWGPALERTTAYHKQRNERMSHQGNGFNLSSSFVDVHSPSAEASSGAFSVPAASPYDKHVAPYSPVLANHDSSGNPFDAVLPRPLLLHIVEVYFDYVYALIPCLHKPSFMHDLHNHREEQPGQEEWVALVFSVIEATLVQMPHSFISLPKREIKILFSRAHTLVKNFLDRDFVDLSVSRTIIFYFHGVAATHMGNPFRTDTVFGRNYLLSLRLRLHEESAYQDLNPIERELRKRVFWLQYGGDKTIAAIEGSPVIWHEVDCADVTLPSPLDDEYVTANGYMDQPEGHTPVLAGFYYISKLFRLLGQVIDKRRTDRSKPPSGLMLQMRINEVEQIFHQVMTLMDNCPDALKLDLGGTPGSRMEMLDAEWDAHISADIRQLLLDPTKANRAVVKDSFLVQQANIYVTQQMVRYIVLQYREELGLLQEKELGQSLDENEPPGVPSRRRLSAVRRSGFSDEEKDQIASDLLMILSKIRMEVLAVNSVALVAKVRFVASTLLDALQNPSAVPDTPDQIRANDRTARAQGYLWDFLRILSDIEALYVIDEDE